MTDNPLTIRDAYDLPRPEDIRAMGFVIKLRELTAGSAELAQLVDDYVVTPAVAKDLPVLFEKLRQVFDRGEEYGRFIHGSFGSGKSHFMTMLSLLLEGAGAAWQKEHAAFATLRSKHQGWVEQAHLLVVRIHMLSVKGKGTGLDRAVYDGFNEALRRRAKAPFEFLHVDGVLDEARREAQQYGDVFWKGLANAGVVASKDDFEAMAKASLKQREALARAYLAYKGRDAASAGIDPKWSEGLRRMAEHAKAQGFGGVVLLIDEFLLWLGEKSGQEFVEAINDLNVIVDHNTGQRAVPMFVFVARQKDIREFFPDLVDESKIHEQLDHHAQRFEITKLQDIELRHIVKERVLRPKAKDAIAAAVNRLREDHEKILPGLLNNPDVDHAYLKDVYPFHPALIETLIDITALMQRERSALRLLYELLVIHYPTLPLGQFLPVGSAFDAIFPRGGVEASKKIEVLQDIHRQYYERLEPAMKQMLALGGESEDKFDEKRRHALDQLVKTVLLAEVSPRLKGKGLTIERLVQLNSVDVEGETFRSQLRVAATDLVDLSNRVLDLQVSSTDKMAIVRYVLGGVSLGEVLSRARSKVDNGAQRFNVFYGALKKALGIEGSRGFDDGDDNVGEYELRWRGTRRKGRLCIGNVRELQYDAFEDAEGGFTVLIDYPWDEPGHSVEEDRQKAMAVRKTRGNKHTVCWLPRHLSPAELSIVTDLAAATYVVSKVGQDDLLDLLSQSDRTRVVDLAAGRVKLLIEQLEALLKKVYIEHGEFFALVSDLDTKRPYDELASNLKHIAGLLMDRRYPQHPVFLVEPKKADLGRLLEWMVAAGDATTSVSYDEETAKALKTLGQPLELVNLGQTKASLRLDSRYIKDVLQRADRDVVNWTEVAEALREQYGLQPLVLDLFLGFLCQRDHRALHLVSGDPIEVTLGMPASAAVRLERGKLVGPAEWSRLRELAVQLLSLPHPPAQRSLQQQDKLAAAMRQKGVERKQALAGLYERLGHLGVEAGARRTELATANERLIPLAESTTDSYRVLAALLAKWPERSDDPVRAVVQGVDAAREALGELDDKAREHLARGKAHPTVGPHVTAHLEQLGSFLGAASAERPLSRSWIAEWNKRAQGLISQMIGAQPEPPPPGPGPGAGAAPPPPPAPERVLYSEVVNLKSKSAVGDAIARIKATLDGAGRGRVRVTITREDD